MGASKPGQLHELFTKYFNASDVDGLLTLYEEGASLVAAPGTIVVGKDSIQAILEGFLALRGTIQFIGADVSIVSGDLALTHGRWIIKADGFDDIEAATAEVSRRQSDGSWKYVIDNPLGTQVLE